MASVTMVKNNLEQMFSYKQYHWKARTNLHIREKGVVTYYHFVCLTCYFEYVGCTIQPLFKRIQGLHQHTKINPNHHVYINILEQNTEMDKKQRESTELDYMQMFRTVGTGNRKLTAYQRKLFEEHEGNGERRHQHGQRETYLNRILDLEAKKRCWME